MSRPEGLAARLLAAAVALPAAAPAGADAPPDRGLIAFKYLDYIDSQPGDRRVGVKAPALQVLMPIAGDWSVNGTYITDSISGASPAYHTTALKRLTDFRRAGTVSVTRYLPDGQVTLGAAGSTERDYLSHSVSMQASLSSEDRNTTFTVALAGTSDRINPVNRVVENERKRVTDVLVGITRVLSPGDLVQLNLTHSRGSGYFSDPYKVFDQRPDFRNHTALLLRWNHHVSATDGVARFSYRRFADTYGIRAHTFAGEYAHPLGKGWSVTPSLRYYTQRAARFYVDVDPDSGPFPTSPPPDATVYSLDQRLSGFGALTLGLKLIWRIDTDWTVDLKLEQYRQQANWKMGGDGSPGLARFDARFAQIGVARYFW